MSVAREHHDFPTRSYPYRYRSADELAQSEPEPPLTAGRVHAFVLGLDDAARLMADDEVDAVLCDPFAELLLKRGVFPLTARALLSALDATNGDPDGVPDQKTFFAADGGQILWSQETKNLNRFFRFVIVRFRDGNAHLMIAASTNLDSYTQFIQVLAWDPKNAAFNFYERRSGTWIWAGNSFHALAPKTRGLGPFDSHVNGALVMKELRAPWINWHSQAASITDLALAPDDPLRTEALFTGRTSAHELETSIVRPGIVRWNRSRLEKALSREADRLHDVQSFMVQILDTTTVNLASSAERSAGVQDDTVLPLPTTFFLNTDSLIDDIGLEPDISPITVSGRFYKDSLTRFQFMLTDGVQKIHGDTFFAFMVPEPAFEDTNILSLLLAERIISPRFVACLCMVDFANPVYSSRRKTLMQYAPASARLTSDRTPRSDLETLMVSSIDASPASSDASSPEAEFLANWKVSEAAWKSEFSRRIETYFAALESKAKTASGFDGWVRLAESRRRRFRDRPLAEFKLTTPTTNIPLDALPLEMAPDGSVREIRA